MARLDLAIAHGQDAVTAGQNFEHVITAAGETYGRYIERVAWAEDRRSVALGGRGFEVVVSYDEKNVYAQGDVPFAVKLFESPIRLFVGRALAKKSRGG